MMCDRLGARELTTEIGVVATLTAYISTTFVCLSNIPFVASKCTIVPSRNCICIGSLGHRPVSSYRNARRVCGQVARNGNTQLARCGGRPRRKKTRHISAYIGPKL